MEYLFNLVHAFFSSISMERDRTLLGPVEMQVESQIKVNDRDFPRIQINVRMTTAEGSPVRFALEVIGLFDYVGNNPEDGKRQVIDFARDKGLHMIWPYATQMLRIISGQMGMNPLDTKTPVSFDIAVEPMPAAPVKRAKAAKDKKRAMARKRA